MADDDSRELSGRPLADDLVEQRRPRRAGEDNEAVMTRSEEELWIATVRRETQRARLTRYVEIETVTKTVEVRHEQVRVEYSPVSDDDLDRPATGSAAGGGGWLTLYDEEVVVTTRRVPRERVRLRTYTVTEDREISEPLRKEQSKSTEQAAFGSSYRVHCDPRSGGDGGYGRSGSVSDSTIG